MSFQATEPPSRPTFPPRAPSALFSGDFQELVMPPMGGQGVLECPHRRKNAMMAITAAVNPLPWEQPLLSAPQRASDQSDSAAAGDHLADPPGRMALAADESQHGLRLRLIGDDDHADAHVEDLV
jgi:hypothetical protein